MAQHHLLDPVNEADGVIRSLEALDVRDSFQQNKPTSRRASLPTNLDSNTITKDSKRLRSSSSTNPIPLLTKRIRFNSTVEIMNGGGIINNQNGGPPQPDPNAAANAFEPFLTTEQLPYYRDARKKALSHQRMIIRLDYLTNCKDNNLTPTEIVYRPSPPQGIDLNPAEISRWKNKVAECEAHMLNLMIDTCRRDLTIRQREMDTSQQDLIISLNDNAELRIRCETELAQKVSTIRQSTQRKYNEMLQSAQRRRADFTRNTNIFRLNRPTNNGPAPNRNQGSSRSRSRSRSNTPARDIANNRQSDDRNQVQMLDLANVLSNLLQGRNRDQNGPRRGGYTPYRGNNNNRRQGRRGGPRGRRY